MSVMQIMNTAWNAISPIVMLISFGYILKQKGFITKEFADVGNAFAFRFCIPAMLFVNTYEIQSLRDVNFQITLYCLGVSFLIFLFGFVSSMVFTSVPERRGVMLQCCFRSNFAIIGLPLSNILGGTASVTVASVLSAATIPFYNVLAVFSLTYFIGSSEKAGDRIKTILRNIARNPLIQGVALGLVTICIRELQNALFGSVVFSLKRDLSFVYTFLTNLKSVTTPLSLIVLGAQFEFGAVRGLFKEICVATVWRTILAPVIGVGLAIFLSSQGILACGKVEIPALVALYGSPVAVSSAIMASSMKNDGQLAAQLVVWTSIVSIFTLFTQICILLYFGFI